VGGLRLSLGSVEAIRALVAAKRSARSTKIKTLNQIRHLIFTAPENYVNGSPGPCQLVCQIWWARKSNARLQACAYTLARSDVSARMDSNPQPSDPLEGGPQMAAFSGLPCTNTARV
jgi:hypothetical protein